MRVTRRQVLAAVATAGVTAVAGCNDAGTSPRDAESTTTGTTTATTDATTDATTATTTVQEISPSPATRLTNSDASPGDSFGVSVAVDSGTALIGSVDEDPNGRLAGAAYVFEASDDGWTEAAKLVPDDGDERDLVGLPVDLAGDTAVVGAGADEDPNGKGAGAAYVFERADGEWSQRAKLTASDGVAGDQFGAVSTDGSAALVGAAGADTDSGDKAGVAYVFARDGDGWTEQTKLAAQDADGEDRFGIATAMTEDVALVGADFDETVAPKAGAAYVFDRSDWSQVAKLTPTDESYVDNFGYSLAVDGDRAVVGAPGFSNPDDQTGAAYVFERDGGDWSRAATLTAANGESVDRFGWAVDVTGQTVLVSAVHDETTHGEEGGSVYAFTPDGGSWTQAAKVVPDTGGREANFGWGLGCDGRAAIVGAANEDTDAGTDAGVAYAYDLW